MTARLQLQRLVAAVGGKKAAVANLPSPIIMYARVSLDLEMYASEPSVGGHLEAWAVGSELLTDNPTNFGYSAENASFDAGNET